MLGKTFTLMRYGMKVVKRCIHTSIDKVKVAVMHLLSLIFYISLHIYTYVYIYIYTYMYVYIYIYTHVDLYVTYMDIHHS